MTASCVVSTKLPKKEALDPAKQKTIEKPVALSGKGLFTGEKVTLTFCPAKPGTGIIFERTDLQGKSPLPATLDQVVDTPRCTILGNGEFTIHTVEHVLAAVYALGIDNLLLQLSGPEVPIMDGSAYPFVTALLEGEIAEQDAPRKCHILKRPVSWSKGDVHIIAIPSEEMRVSYTLHFPESTLLHSQFYSAPITQEHFAQEIAPCRTFCLYEEIAPFIEKGLIKGGGLDNAVIIKNDVVVNAEGIRFSDEMVRHKILDLVGDLSLIPIPVQAHIVAIRSGHASNVAFASELYNQIKREIA